MCPACGGEDSDFVGGAVARNVMRDGSVTTHCRACREVSFIFEPDMVCTDCLYLLPDLNERLRERFAVQGPGSSEGLACIGCGFMERTPRMAQTVGCPHCSGELSVEQDDCPQQGMIFPCEFCGKAVRIPPTVWCPDCGLNFRRDGFADLVSEANA